jgi:hypothetical protein
MDISMRLKKFTISLLTVTILNGLLVDCTTQNEAKAEIALSVWKLAFNWDFATITTN